MLLTPPALAGGKNQSANWEMVYHWCANAAPEYLFDGEFDDWMDSCISDRSKKKRRK